MLQLDLVWPYEELEVQVAILQIQWKQPDIDSLLQSLLTHAGFLRTSCSTSLIHTIRETTMLGALCSISGILIHLF